MHEKEYRRQYRIANRERLKEVLRKYRETHREELRLYAKQYYEEHKNDPEYKAKQKAYHAEWQRKNRDRVNAYKREH